MRFIVSAPNFCSAAPYSRGSSANGNAPSSFIPKSMK